MAHGNCIYGHQQGQMRKPSEINLVVVKNGRTDENRETYLHRWDILNFHGKISFSDMNKSSKLDSLQLLRAISNKENGRC